MKILLVYHKDPYSINPRGGEISVRAIIEHLKSKGHTVLMFGAPVLDEFVKADLVLTWGRPAEQVARLCRRFNKPMVLMVRWFRNICPLPAGNLMEREIDHDFTASKRVIFETASAIITNTDYARKVIERWQPVSRGKVHVSYVPILGEYDPIENPGEKITVITPEVYGENWLVNGLAKLMPDQKFLVVNAKPQYFTAEHPNIEVCGYMDQDEIWRRTKVLLVPVYGNDICGTRRVTIEAMRKGVPVLASAACGMREKVLSSYVLPRDADLIQWKTAIMNINSDPEAFVRLANFDWSQYNTPAQLEQFEQILLNCV